MIGAIVGGASSLMLGLGVWLRRRRKRRGDDEPSSFRPRARFRGYFSISTHKNLESDKPPGFEDESDTSRRRRPPL